MVTQTFANPIQYIYVIISVKHNIFLIIPRYSTERQEQSRIWRISPQDQGQPSLLQLFVHDMITGKHILKNSKLRSPVKVDDDCDGN